MWLPNPLRMRTKLPGGSTGATPICSLYLVSDCFQFYSLATPQPPWLISVPKQCEPLTASVLWGHVPSIALIFPRSLHGSFSIFRALSKCHLLREASLDSSKALLIMPQCIINTFPWFIFILVFISIWRDLFYLFVYILVTILHARIASMRTANLLLYFQPPGLPIIKIYNKNLLNEWLNIITFWTPKIKNKLKRFPGKWNKLFIKE